MLKYDTGNAKQIQKFMDEGKLSKEDGEVLLGRLNLEIENTNKIISIMMSKGAPKGFSEARVYDEHKITKAKDAHIWNMLCWLEKIDYLIKNGVMDKDKAQSTIARIRGMINKELGVVGE